MWLQQHEARPFDEFFLDKNAEGAFAEALLVSFLSMNVSMYF